MEDILFVDCTGCAYRKCAIVDVVDDANDIINVTITSTLGGYRVLYARHTHGSDGPHLKQVPHPATPLYAQRKWLVYAIYKESLNTRALAHMRWGNLERLCGRVADVTIADSFFRLR